MTVSTEATETTDSAGVTRRAVVRVVCWVALVVSALLALWGTPRMTSQDDMAKSVKAGDVRMVELEPGRYNLENELLNVNVTSTKAVVVVWEDTSGRLHRTDLTPLYYGRPTAAGATADASTMDLAATINATAKAAGVSPPTYVGMGIARFAMVPLTLCSIAAFLLLVFGRQPRRVTKWGMFWLLGIPLGAGLAWWLWREAPFNPAMSAAAEPAPRQRGMTPAGVLRAGGGKTFLLSWAAAIGMAVVLTMVIGVQSTSNGSSDPTVQWSSVPQTAVAP